MCRELSGVVFGKSRNSVVEERRRNRRFKISVLYELAQVTRRPAKAAHHVADAARRHEATTCEPTPPFLVPITIESLRGQALASPRRVPGSPLNRARLK